VARLSAHAASTLIASTARDGQVNPVRTERPNMNASTVQSVKRGAFGNRSHEPVHRRHTSHL